MDLSHRKTILRKISNGLFIVTSAHKSEATGAVISFLTQSSIDPPLVTMGIRTDSELYKLVMKSRQLAIHFSSRNQQDMVASFFRITDKNESQLNGYSFELSNTGNPLLVDIPMIIEGKVIDIVKRGDHHLFVTEIFHTILREETDVLALHHTNWHYGG